MKKNPPKLKCFLCSREFNFGMGQYHGKHLKSYEITVCDTCYDSNWDGWLQENENKIVKHLKEKNLPIPEKNAKGWFPRD